ncbi:cupin domain-containing protein [Streptomyces sp. NPDC058287]|uniref:cupin domain-containing protein n=1 Tax=unclassified Streptomyces TaxID=2593676 RepID=UPI0036E789C4
MAGKYRSMSVWTLPGGERADDDGHMSDDQMKTGDAHQVKTADADRVQIVEVDQVEPVEVAPGITCRRLAGTEWARGWLYDFAPGAQWPEIDVHEGEERYYVLAGEFLDCGRRLGPGSYVVFAPGSSHRPRSETGARMLGISIPPR